MPLKIISLLLVALLLGACASTQDGNASWSGSARSEKISENEYVVTAGTNAISGPARLRPLVVAKAREVAKAAGFPGFVVIAPSVGRARHGDGNEAVARIRLVRSATDLSAEDEYFDASAPDLAPRPASLDESRLAVVQGSAAKDTGDASLLVFPFYFDALDSREQFAAPRINLLEPRTHLIVAHVMYKRSTFSAWQQTSVPIRAALQAGASYRLSGAIDQNRIVVWLEDQRTGLKVVQRALSSN